MAQKKKASAARTATVNVPSSPAQEVTAPVRSTSSAPADGDSRRAGVVRESQAGSGVEVPPLSENGGGAQRRRDVSGKVDVTGKASRKDGARAGASNGSGKVLPATGPGGSTVTCSGKDETANSALIRGECEKALVALRRGNSTKALRLIKDACSRNEAFGVAHRVQGHIFMRLASVIEDTNTKQRHFASALESAKKAASLSPQSVEYAHFYAQLLFEAAKDSEGYGEVVRECERALSIEDPIDPARESLHNEQQQELPTAEARIAHVHQELKALVQKANMPYISTWMKTLGTGAGEEKLRFVQMRKFADQDPMEQRVSQPKRPHEVKKVVKTPEERRKEIEVRVAAAKLLQQRDTSAEGGADTTDDHEKSLQKKLERRKSSGPNSRRLSKPLSIDERIDRVRQFWHALTQESRETKLVVSIAEMKDHLTSWKEAGGLVKSHAASDALSEALEFAQEKKTWRFWACCKCGERFISYQDLSHHTWEEHIRSLPEKLQQVVPQEINQEWVDQLLDEDCRPIDGVAAVRMLIESARSFLPDELQAVEPVTTESENLNPQKYENEDIIAKSVEDTNQKMIEKDVSLEDIEAGFGQAASGVDQGQLHMCKGDCQNGMKVGKEIPSHDLPSAEDEVRRKLLEKIYGLFRILIKSKYLAQDHVTKIILYAIEEIQSLVPDPTVHYEFNQSPLYIRFLDPHPLRQIQKYLMELAQACGVSSQSENPVQPSGEETGEEEIIQDRLFLNEDFTQLLLDERVVKEFPSGETLEHGGAEEIAAEKGAATHRPPLPLMKGKDGEPIPKHVDLQLSWIFGTTEYEFQPSGWKQFREEQGQRGRDVYCAFEKEFQRLYTLCEKKYELVSYEEALNLVERLCIEENRRRDLLNDGTGKRFETVLKERQQELFDARIRGLSSAQKVELDAISNVLRDAQSGMVRRHPYDGSLGVRVSDSDEDEDEAWRMQESLSRADTRVDAVILRQREQLSNEVNHLDAKIMKATDDLQKMEIKLGQLAVLDYRAVVLPLVKSLLQSRLEGEAEKDAMQKSDAAQEAFLAELAKDRKSSGSKESENLKQAREKSKEKKKAKEQKKLKDVKRGPSNSEQQVEAASVETHEVDDADNWDWTVEDDRQQLELHQTLFEEECKLLEALEAQRRAEEEAKQKHLTGAVETPSKGVEDVGKGLRNDSGQYNCFLNVVIQSLWHLQRFREELLADSSMQHVHVGNPCVVCALRDIFWGLDTPAHNSSSRDAVAPTALRVALSVYSDFQEAQMNDASEVIPVIFECLHQAFVPNSSCDGGSKSSTTGGSWDCQGPHPCMAHALFGLDVAEQMNCQHCGLESRHLKYTTFFHNINASALRTAKVLCQDSSMDKLLELVEMNHQLACDTETGGCGRQNHIHHLLQAAPSVFTMVLGWQNGRESFEDISATVDAMDVTLDVGVIYRGLDKGFLHRLVSVVCYYGQHYHCFAYNQELGRWVMFDDSTVKVIGEWSDVANTCRRGHLQPQVLFYEAVAARSEALTVTLC